MSVRETIRYAIGHSLLGPFVIATTTRGVCALAFTADATSLGHYLPKADFVEDSTDLMALIHAVEAKIETPTTSCDIRLDLRGTNFQQHIWQALCAIPLGQTRSYGELANTVGKPGAARAIARACADNPVAVLVPCHRVVRSTGALAGYRWGLERKAWLLARERDVHMPSSPPQP